MQSRNKLPSLIILFPSSINISALKLLRHQQEKLLSMENCYAEIEPFWKISKNFGLFPMSFEGPIGKGSLKFTKLSILRTTMVFGFLLFMIGMIIFNHFVYQSANQSFFESKVWSWFLLLAFPSLIIELIYQIYKTNETKDFIHFMGETDQKFHGLYLKIDHRKYRKFILYVTVTIFGMMLIRFFASLIWFSISDGYYKTGGKMLTQETGYTAVLFFECYFSLQFIFPTFQIRERFVLLRNLLR